MPCCGVCRPKSKPIIKKNKNISKAKINTIDLWIENIEGPNESIVLPSQPPHQPISITNAEEIAQSQQNQIFNLDNKNINQHDSTLKRS